MAIELKKGIHSATSLPIVFLSGDTYPIRNVLGRNGLGFAWYRPRSIWWMYETQFNKNRDSILKTLKSNGVDISSMEAYSKEYPPQESVPASGTEDANDIEDKETSSIKTDKITNTNKYSYVNFPVNPNIYSTEFNIIADGKGLPIKITVGRIEHIKRLKTTPVYKFNIEFLGKLVRSIDVVQREGKWLSSGPNYDEDAFVAENIEKIKNFFSEENRDKSKTYRIVQNVLLKSKRNSNFSKFLEQWGSSRFDKDKRQGVESFIPEAKIYVDKYRQEFDIAFEGNEDMVYAYTDVKHPLAPSKNTLAYIDIPPSISSFEEFYKFIAEYIDANKAKISAEYTKYLDSFPFLEEAHAKNKAEMAEIMRMIENNYFDTEQIKSRLEDYGYIRPKKRGDGWVVTKEAIDPGYSTSNGIDDFYGVIGYWLSRKKRNVSSWTDMMLTLALDNLRRIIKKLGYEVSSRELSSFIEKIVDAVYKDLFGEESPGGVWDQYQQFYGDSSWRDRNRARNDSGRESEPAEPEVAPSMSSLDDWASFVQSIGGDPALAKNDPKSAFRQVTYHGASPMAFERKS